MGRPQRRPNHSAKSPRAQGPLTTGAARRWNVGLGVLPGGRQCPEAEIVTRQFRIERGSEGEISRISVEGLIEAVNSKGRRRHWYPVWASAGRRQDLSWLDVSRLLWIDLVVCSPASTRSIASSRTSSGVDGAARR